MYKSRLCLGVMNEKLMSVENQIRLFKKTGFDGFFTGWSEKLADYRKVADEEKMIYQSVHAPFLNANKMWGRDSESEAATDELIRCIDDTASISVPIVVVHPYIGFEEKRSITQDGLDNYGKVVERAIQKNVKIAFENVEGEEYLEALMKEFGECNNVGFCWDSGHELCYNRGKDMLSLYGNKLIATHINDNLGVSDYEGKIYWTDDLHLLPFDGINDWNNAASRLNKCGYDGILTFELTPFSKPQRHDNDKYSKMDFELYIAECYARACRFAYIKNKILI